ncbi:MAG: AbrB/MazE/SpoVT family DNA-binding domain-containing protein [Candidatus Hydrogenedentes bacterium]|nr:AbrB/MazE/SpoVT family DNA-binding domain-containing protein [Candidatus Hydrogenedentota bacterium]
MQGTKMRVSTKGQVTIPLHLRKKIGIFPGCEVEFGEAKGQLYIRKVKGTSRGKDLVQRMTGKGTVKMTTGEILALTRGED